MRISEFSETDGKAILRLKKSHNIRANCVRISDIGLSITFESDKTSKFSGLIKHRMIKWPKLPRMTREVVEEYTRMRPREAATYRILIT